MKKFSIIIAAVIILIILIGLKATTYPLPSNLEYYWGNGCPHCKKVEEFLSSWDPPIGEAGKKNKIDKKEVWNNEANAQELKARYEYCKITNPSEMGIPLLFTPEGKCYSGDTPIIDYLKNLK